MEDTQVQQSYEDLGLQNVWKMSLPNAGKQT